jgi:hypothetical protein
MLKKRLTVKNIIFILLAYIVNVSAEEKVAFSWEFVNIGVGFNFSSYRNNTEFSAGLFNFFFDNNKTNVGIKLSPSNIRVNASMKESDKTITEMNFLNFSIYKNFLKEDDLMLGPFSSIQYINLRNWETVDYRDMTVNAGLYFVYKIEDIERIDGKFIRLSMELGYGYNYYDKHKFYYNVSVDLIKPLIMFLKVVGWFWSNNHTEPAYYKINYD